MRPQHLAGIIVSAVVALALLGSIAHSDASEESFGLLGTWRLERKENFEAYLRESGAPWWKRKLAQLGSSRVRQTIERADNRMLITTENPLQTRTETFVADGETQVSFEAASGDLMTWTASFEGTVFVADGHGDLGHRIVRREIVDNMMVMTILNPDADTQCKFFFRRNEMD